MLRPERMSKVSVTGSRRVMPAVIETVHELCVLHLSDYDGSWAGFDNGDPMEGADEIAERLVTVRALESALALEEGGADPADLPENWRDRLERVRTEVTALDDRRTERREELRQLDERIDRLEPFAELGIDLDLLSGYRSVEVAVGEADRDAVEAALEDSASIRAHETFAAGGVVAIVAAPAADGTLDDALVGLEFAAYEVPDASGDPEAHLATLEESRAELEAALEEIEAELADIAEEEGTFLLQVEAELTVRLNRAEAPLQFATTGRAFIAEGWIPTEQLETFEAALEDAVGDALEIEELERAEYDRHGTPVHTGTAAPKEGGVVETEPEEPAREKAAPDGGTEEGVVTMGDDPPVVLNNLTPAKPFEMMVKMVSQPKYSELDPTLLVFLTFPVAFGFMIGDIGYGILYVAMGVALWKLMDSDAGKALGTIAIWAGVFTIIFGYLYDDFFGVHMSYLGLGWLPLAGTLDKGLQLEQWALLWIVASILFGLVHLNIGLIMGFVNELRHGITAAVLEKGSWILSLNGLFIWILSTHMASGKPDFVVGPESTLNEFVGFAGFPEPIGLAALALAALGFVMVGVGEGAAGLAEWPAWAFGHALSYLRMVAVLLAKGGMAFVVNVLVFGSYTNEAGYTVFNLPTYDVTGYEQDFVGLIHADPFWITIPAAILVFVLGHVLVLVLGITAAGIQMLRLEYVEFFQKFYEGGGEEYDPFGNERPGSSEPV